MSKKKFMILYGFMVHYGENNRGPPSPVVFGQNERPWLLGLKVSSTFSSFRRVSSDPFRKSDNNENCRSCFPSPSKAAFLFPFPPNRKRSCRILR